MSYFDSCMRVAAITMMAAVAAASGAQSYPSRSIRYVVPQAPGGSSDTLARVVAPRLGEALGQQVIVDNKAGGTGVIGAEFAVRAAPDGHTIIQVATSHATNPATGKKLPYDTIADFAPITLLSSQPNIWLAHPSLPVRNIKELVALARGKPGAIDFASSGTGGSQHLAGELLNLMTGIQLVHIPYKGSPPALIDVLAGRVSLMSSTMAPAIPHIRNQRLRALAVTSARRSIAAPEIPTVAESGVPGYEAIAWQGVLAPAGTPQAVLARLSAELGKVMAQPEVRKHLLEQGFEPATTTESEFAQFIRNEIAKWTKVMAAQKTVGAAGG